MPQDKIDGVLSTLPVILYMTFPDYEINFQNLTSPYKPYIRTENFIFSTQTMNSYLYYLKKTFITSDYDFVFQNEKKVHSYQSYTMQSVSSLGTSFFVSEGFGVFQLALSSNANMHYRSYIKLQSLVANIGGVVNFIILFARVLIGYVAKKLLLLEFVNNRCKFKPSSVAGRDIRQHTPINIKITENNYTSGISGIGLQQNIDPFKQQEK
jgi:hypothetical protein